MANHNENGPPKEKDDDFDKAAKVFAKVAVTVIATCALVIFIALTIKVLFIIW